MYSIFTICWKKNSLIFQLRVKKLSQFLSVVIDLSAFGMQLINRTGITITPQPENLKHVCNFTQLVWKDPKFMGIIIVTDSDQKVSSVCSYEPTTNIYDISI